MFPSIVVLPQSVALADTAVTKHYIHPQHQKFCTNVRQIQTAPIIKASSGHILLSNKTTQLPLSKDLEKEDSKGYVLSNLKTISLVSIGKLCDYECIETFDKNQVVITKNNIFIVNGTRDPITGMWTLPLRRKEEEQRIEASQQANGVLQDTKTLSDLAHFYHACLFCPTKDTLLRAVKKDHFRNWTGLNRELISNNLNKTPETIRGHQRLQRKNFQST